MNVFEEIKSLLNERNIEYKLIEHEPVRTSEEAAKVRGVELKTGAKAMVIKTKDDFVLIVLPADLKINWKKVKETLKVKEVRFATTEEAEEITKVQMGSVPPFGTILNLKTYCDPKILENEWINFNPGSKTHSITMKSSDLVELVKPIIAEISQ